MKLPPARAKVTLAELAKEQAAARTHLTFLLTLACPLKCEHCIVNAGPDMGRTTMPLEVAEWYASQMPELYQYGIRMLSLTGGEPLLARRQLKVMSDAGDAAGMICGVVTAAHWAHSHKRATAVVKSFPGIHLWDLSLDAYHLEFLPFQRVRTAYEAVKECGRAAALRFTFRDPLTPQDRQAMEFLDSFADPADIFSQRLRSSGRAANVPVIELLDQRTFMKPCVTKGMVVRYDGTTAPCCVTLVEERRHPFQFGDPRKRRLRDMHADYIIDPLLQMIRVLGFGEIVGWLKRAGLELVLPERMPEDVCDLCPYIVTNQIATNLLNELCSRPDIRLKIAVLANQVLDEPAMLHRSLQELRPLAATLDGFAVAEALAEQPHPTAAVGEANAHSS